jgi:MFS family permease
MVVRGCSPSGSSFSLASLTGGLTTSELVLIAARATQGVGAALASATGLALIIRIFGPLGRLNQALGVFTAVSSAGFASGVILGGVLTQTLGWRWVFFVNVPIGLVASVLAIKFLPRSADAQKTSGHLDVPGAISITTGLILLVYALTEVGNGDYSATTYLLFGLAAATLASFLAIEYRSRAPLMPLGFLRRNIIFFANATALLTFAAKTSMVFILTVYLQTLLLYSPLYAALALVPGALVYFILGGFVAPKLVRRVGAKPVLVGAMLAFTAGLLLLSRVSTDAGYVTDILPGLLISSVGGALSLTASNIAALSGAHRGEEGVASGLINTSRQIGGPIGLAVAITVVGLVTHGLGVTASIGEVVLAFHYGFIAIAGFTSAAVITSLLLTGKPGAKPTTAIGQQTAGAAPAQVPVAAPVESLPPGE